jgi:tetratricopeptide (TPR) repeat protein
MLDTVVQISAGGGDESIASRHSTGETYLQLAGKLPARQADQGGTLRIYWDKSRSRRDHDHQAEYRRVREAIAALKPERIEWVAFSSGEPERALLKDADEAVRRASALRYGGATSFGKIAGDAPARNCLLVSDGRPTIDGTPAAALPCRLFTVATQGADMARLGAMAQASGGQLVTADRKAVDWLSPAVTAVLGPDGRRLEFTSLPAAPGEWRVAAKAPATTGPVRVMVGDVAIGRNVDPDPARFDGEGSLMAAASLAALDSATDRPRFIALSRRYSVASPTMSFVVLEQPEDYVTNKIAPPANYTRRREWEELAAEAEEDLADAKAGRLAVVRKEWAEQVAWWERKFDLRPRPVVRYNKTVGSAALPSVRNEPPPASAPPPPPPPPPPEPERDGDESTAELVVTGTRIPHANLDSASPVSVVGNADANQRASRPDVRIAVSAWRPDRDSLNAFDADPAAFARVFPEWDKKAGGVPAFYLDTADWLDRRGKRAEALETLMSALDLPTANEITVGMVAARLERWGLIDEAIALRERQAALDPEHPQPKRLLALALAKRGTKADLDRAIRLLTEIALNPVDGNWEGIDMIALVEANALIPRYRAMGGKVDLDSSLIRNLDSDVRIVIDWTSDAVDIDLWVDQPNGERAIYNHNRTSIGGHLSNDMTEGYGPEEYFIRRGAIGRYSVTADVYASDRIDPNGVSRITAHLFRDWGRPNQRVESIDLDLQSGKADKVKIGTLRVGGAAAGSQ